MIAHLAEWLELAARWLHVIAGAAWIGTSFYFNWLNDSFRPAQEADGGVEGEVWSVHGGRFYRVSKYRASAERLPSALHWFKWEAYFTWVTGFVLLVLIYYMGSGAFLIDPSVTELGVPTAIGIGVGTLVVGWFVYDALCRSRLADRPLLLLTVVFVLVVAAAWGLGRVLSPRAAYIHVGAMMGTWMAANVFRVIIPGQKRMVRAIERGEEPDIGAGDQGALRSLHNNYLTLPVLYVMVSNHYPVTYAHPHAWLILAGVFAVGVAARHYYNLRHRGRHVPVLLGGAIAGMILIAVVTLPPARTTVEIDRNASGTFPIVRAIVDARCVTCHSATPTHPTAPVAPMGISLDRDDEIVRYSDRIERAVVSGQMPLGNVTGMTEEERTLIVRWVSEGARTTGEESTR